MRKWGFHLSSHSACELTHVSKEAPLQPQASSEQTDAEIRSQVSREMLLVHCQAWTCLSIVTLDCTSSAYRFLPKTFNEKKFLSTPSPTFILTKNPFLLALFQHCVSKSAEVIPLFLLFLHKMEGNIKLKVQTNGMIAIHQGDSTVTIYPLKMRGFIQDLGLA